MKEVARLVADQVKEKLTICSVTGGSPTAVKKGMSVHAQ